MLHHYVFGIGALLLLLAAWVGVQRAWRSAFPDVEGDPDVLAGRSGCHGCSGRCNRRLENGSCKIEEEIR